MSHKPIYIYYDNRYQGLEFDSKHNFTYTLFISQLINGLWDEILSIQLSLKFSTTLRATNEVLLLPAYGKKLSRMFHLTTCLIFYNRSVLG